jgi:hypothetical protein
MVTLEGLRDATIDITICAVGAVSAVLLILYYNLPLSEQFLWSGILAVASAFCIALLVVWAVVLTLITVRAISE